MIGHWLTTLNQLPDKDLQLITEVWIWSEANWPELKDGNGGCVGLKHPRR